MLTTDNAALVIIDIQGKLAHLMEGKDAFFTAAQNLIQGARLLDIPIVWMEQVPEKLGKTIPEIANLLAGLEPVRKATFSGMACDAVRRKIRETGRKEVLVTGIETHICVYQTVSELQSAGYQTHVVVDAVSSRTRENKVIGLELMRTAGARFTSVETALFEMLRTAEHPNFRKIARIIK